MGAEPVGRDQGYSRDNPCPICEGWDSLARGNGHRCYGFLSTDGSFGRCSREECAGILPFEARTGCYVHKLTGDCACGVRHDRAPRTSTHLTVIERRDRSRRLMGKKDYPVKDEAGTLAAIHRRSDYDGGGKSVAW